MEGMCQKCAQSTTRPCSIYLVLLGPPVSQSLGSARETHTPEETPTIEVAGRPSLIPVMSHGPLPGLFGFWGRVLQQRKPTPRSGDSQSSRKCAHAQGHT